MFLSFLKFGIVAQIATTATFYDNWFEGKTMANGKAFSQSALTCASNTYPIGTKLRLSKEGRSVIVRVTDRCASNSNIDLTTTAFKKLAPLHRGLIRVRVDIVGRGN